MSYFKSKSHESHSSLIQRNSNFHSAYRQGEEVLETTRLPWWMQGPFTQTDWLVFTMQTRLAPQLDPESFQSHSAVPHVLGLHVSSAGSPSPWASGCNGNESVSLGWCVWTQKGVTSFGMKSDSRIPSQPESTGGSVVLTVLHRLIKCHLSQTGSWNACGSKKDSPVSGVPHLLSD